MGKPTIDMTGKQIHRWTVLSEADRHTKSTAKHWLCVCQCGTQRVLTGYALRSGSSKSCGCLKAENSAIRMREMRHQKCGTLEERFFSRFKVLENGCWQWIAHADKDGYGVMPSNGKNIRAHRYSYEYHVGPIPDGMSICHKCDNPGCVNPEHFFVGSAKDNAQDALAKQRNFVGEKNSRSKLTQEQVKFIRSSNIRSQELASMFNVNKSTINNIRRGATWGHLHSDPINNEPSHN